MSSRARFVLFLAFVLAFLVAAPVAILYTAGYRYDVAGRRITQTGLISVSSVPRGAGVSIDGVSTGRTTPFILKNLAPGERVLGLSRTGYLPWEQTVRVESRTTTFVMNVPLFLDAPSFVAIAADVTRSARDANGERAAYVVDQGSWREVWAFSSRLGRETLLARLPAAANEAAPALAWSANGGFLAIGEAALVNASTGAVVDLAEVVPDAVTGAWDAGEDARWIARRADGSLLAVRADTGAITELGLDADAARAIPNGLALAARLEDRVAISRRENGLSTVVAYIPQGDYRFVPSPPQFFLLEDAARERIVLVDASGADRPILLSAAAKLWQWEPSGRRLLYSDGFELHLYDPSLHRDETLTRVSDPITGLAWYPSAPAMLYAQSHVLAAIALDPDNGHTTSTLAEGEGFRDLWIDPRGKGAYFFGTVGDLSGLLLRRLAQ